MHALRGAWRLPAAFLALALGCGGRSELEVPGVAPWLGGEDATAGGGAVEAAPSSSDGPSSDHAGPEAPGPEAGEPGSTMCPPGCCEPADAGAVDAGRTMVADSVLGFSATQGQCGWSYGYLPAGAEPFTVVTIFTTSQYPTPVWEESTTHPPWIVTFASAQHPNETPLQWNDRRWTSAVPGTVFIQGHLAKSDPTGGDGIVGHIRVADVEIWSATIAYDDTVGVTFNLSADVQVGTPIDFLVDPKTTDLYDTTTLTAVISR